MSTWGREFIWPGTMDALTDGNFSQAGAGDAFTAFLKAFYAAVSEEILPEKLMRRRREMQFGAGQRAGKLLEKCDETVNCVAQRTVQSFVLLCCEHRVVHSESIVYPRKTFPQHANNLCVEKGLRGIYKEGLYSPLDPLCVMLKTLKATQVKLSQSHCYCLEQW